MPVGKPIQSFGDDGDADQKVSGFGGGFGAVTPSFGAAATPAAPAASFGATPAPQAAPGGYAPDRTAGAAEAVKGGAESTIENTNTDWINNKWRPVMGWMYMLVCTCDFVLFPILWSILQALQGGQVTNQWQPLSLQGAGLFHIAMGAVLGVAAYGRTKEKLDSKQ